MSISQKDRKILWGRSGNRCVFCKRLLIEEKTKYDPASIIGEECHIYAKEINGPPRQLKPADLFVDSYENLILLCRDHHKLIDDQPNEYCAEKLKIYKSKHELWVKNTLILRKRVKIKTL